MSWSTPARRDLVSLLLLTAAAVGLLLALPPEQTLGTVIRVIFLHGALVQVGLLIFAAAGILALVYLWTRRSGVGDPTVYGWLVAAQRTGLVIWVVYALSSMLSTYLAWGQWVAWDEPRVRASAGVSGVMRRSLPARVSAPCTRDLCISLIGSSSFSRRSALPLPWASSPSTVASLSASFMSCTRKGFSSLTMMAGAW